MATAGITSTRRLRPTSCAPALWAEKCASIGLVRASSNKPELVVVVESPVSEKRMRDMFEMVDSVLRTHPEVGAYNQKI